MTREKGLIRHNRKKKELLNSRWIFPREREADGQNGGYKRNRK
jgi:hypothetical protein